MGQVVDEILESRGLDFDDLDEEEKKTYFKWLGEEQHGIVTLDQIKEHIQQMKMSVELQLMSTDPFTYVLWFKVPNLKHAHLKARLHNYLLLEGLLTRPERAKQLLESYKNPTKL
ncbi:MAG: hypothetical protein KGI08_05235 [Thaumarchaeota archaeon]|nr:hypothetical protein [Nitrososphaerota archaeon]